MNLNPELIPTRCREIEESLGRLEKIKAGKKEDFLKDRDLQDTACYRLLVPSKPPWGYAIIRAEGVSMGIK